MPLLFLWWWENECGGWKRGGRAAKTNAWVAGGRSWLGDKVEGAKEFGMDLDSFKLIALLRVRRMCTTTFNGCTDGMGRGGTRIVKVSGHRMHPSAMLRSHLITYTLRHYGLVRSSLLCLRVYGYGPRMTSPGSLRFPPPTSSFRPPPHPYTILHPRPPTKSAAVAQAPAQHSSQTGSSPTLPFAGSDPP